ncbi:MAG: phosphodiester glycosidase family protein [Candidatus Caldatribacteriaceae bacterium]
MKERKLFATIIITVLLFAIILPLAGAQQSTLVGRGEFLSSLYSILGLSQLKTPDTKSQNPILRLEVVKEVIKALSYDDLLPFASASDLPFPELSNLKVEDQKWVALAVTLNPPLLRGDARGSLNLSQPLTRQDFTYLKETLKAYAQGNISFYREKKLHSHLTLIIKKWGFSPNLVPPEEPQGEQFFLQVGAYQDRERAQRILSWLKELGYPAQIQEENSLFKVRVGPYSKEETKTVGERLKNQGFSSYPILERGNGTSKQPFSGPVFTLALLFDPHDAPFRVEVALANNQIMDREKTSEIARRKNALFAINASFFTKAGEPLGLLVADGRVLSEPIEGWYNCGFTADNEISFGEIKFKAEAIIGNEISYPVKGINRLNQGNELVLYDQFFGPKTPLQKGVECVVRNGIVERVGESQGETPIPPRGFILQGNGKGAQWLIQNTTPGQKIRVKIGLYPVTGDLAKWQRMQYAVSGGPLLFFEGSPGPFGQFNNDVVTKRHPRTVIGETENGEILFLAVDGRRPGHSVGLTIEELVEELKNYRVKNALNLDGGGSTTFYLQGQILNRPADLTGERKISTAILLKKK